MRRVVIREAISTDYDDIVTFYQEYPDDHVMLRTKEAVHNAITKGYFFLGIDLDATNSGRICAASAVYEIEAYSPTGGTLSLREAGGSNVKKEARGFGIHKIMHAARALHTNIFDRGGFHEYFGAILVPNPASVKNILRMGFEEWSDVPAALRADREEYVGQDQSLSFYRFPMSSLQIMARAMLNAYECPVLECRSNETLIQVELVLDVEVTKKYIEIVRAFSAGDLSEYITS